LPALVVAAVALCVAPLLSAQDTAFQLGPNDPRFSVFGGYSGYRAGGKVNSATVPDFTTGFAGQFVLNTSHWTGVVADASSHYNSTVSAQDFAFGIRFHRQVWRLIPFGEVLLGVQHFSPKGLPSQNTPTYNLGAGLDIKVSSRFSVRPLQLSYVNTYYNANLASGTSNYFNGYRVQAGLVYYLGLPSNQGEVTVLCSAAPSEVDSGDPVKVSVVSKGFLPNRKLSYFYKSTGGPVTGNLTEATVDTTGVPSGNYTVTAKVVDNGGRRHQQAAGCEASFSVKTKSAPPATAPKAAAAPAQETPEKTVEKPVEKAVESVPEKAAEKPVENAPEKAASAAPEPGATHAQKEAASPKQAEPQPRKFGIVEFKRDVKRPTRVDNEAKGELDRYADALAATPDARGVLVGFAAAKDAGDNSRRHPIASLRAVNTKSYLVKDKGIDAARIDVRSSGGTGQKVELWLVPVGASLQIKNSSTVDEGKVKAIPRVPLKPRAHPKEKGQKPKQG